MAQRPDRVFFFFAFTSSQQVFLTIHKQQDKQMNLAALVSLVSPRPNTSLHFDRAALRSFSSHVQHTRHPKLVEWRPKLAISGNADARAAQSLRLIAVLIWNNKLALCPGCSGHRGFTSSGTSTQFRLIAVTPPTPADTPPPSLFPPPLLRVFEFACVFLTWQCSTSVIVTCSPCGGQTDR